MKFTCKSAQHRFSAYLDGDLTGLDMAAMAEHLETCPACDHDFAALRAMQSTLAQMGPALTPARLQARLRTAIAQERAQNAHLPLPNRWLRLWQTDLAPLAFRATGGFALAVALVGGLSWLFAAPISSVEANDAERMAHLSAPRYLYSEVPPQPIVTPNDAPVLVDAHVDASGRVYEFAIVEGPTDARTHKQITENLLGSIFKPAEVFGAPVRGHVMLTFSGISVRG